MANAVDEQQQTPEQKKLEAELRRRAEQQQPTPRPDPGRTEKRHG
jgi:hypothetical protein